MMDFYKEFLALKETKRLKWNEIGSAVDKKEGTIRLAFRHKSLKPLEIKALRTKFLGNKSPLIDNSYHLNDTKKNLLMDATGDFKNIDTEDLVRYIVYNQAVLMENPIFKTFIENMGYKIAIDILEGRTNNS